MRKIIIIAAVVLVVAVLIAAANTRVDANPLTNVPNEEGKISGFWGGLWDGIIAIPAFWLNLFTGRGGAIYYPHNSGAGYNFGFLWGAGLLFGGGASISKKRK